MQKAYLVIWCSDVIPELLSKISFFSSKYSFGNLKDGINRLGGGYRFCVFINISKQFLITTQNKSLFLNLAATYSVYYLYAKVQDM